MVGLPGFAIPTETASSCTSRSRQRPRAETNWGHEGGHLVSEAERIADEIGRSLVGDAWHGPSLNEVLRGVTWEDAMQRPIPAAHSIWELVLHITSWANIALRRVTGGQVEPFEGEDWPLPGPISESGWAEACAALTESHQRLREVVAGLSDEDLARNAPQSGRSIAAMLSGVTQHGAYHGGQIAILRKATNVHHRRTAT